MASRGRAVNEQILPKSWFGRSGRLVLAGTLRSVDRYRRVIETNAIGVLVETDYDWQRFYPWSAIESIEADQ
jgi:hypothetical protein